jgi:hypothetical protein
VFVKTKERELARHLRRAQGMAVREIANHVGVSLSSVSVWVRDIPLTAAQRAALDARDPTRNGQRRGTENNSRRCRAERAAAQAHGRALAREAEPLHVQGCMLFWAEGSKRRNSVVLTNSDLGVMQVFVRFLRECYDVADERITLSVNCFVDNGLALGEIEGWWLERLGLPPSCLRAAAVNRPSSASKRLKVGVLLYGTARVSVHSTFIVQSIYGAIQEYAGIDRPEWLDL